MLPLQSHFFVHTWLTFDRVGFQLSSFQQADGKRHERTVRAPCVPKEKSLLSFSSTADLFQKLQDKRIDHTPRLVDLVQKGGGIATCGQLSVTRGRRYRRKL